MNRRKTLKIIGGSVLGIAGLTLIDQKWKFVDQLTETGLFTSKEKQLISVIADTIIPEGLPPKVSEKDPQPLGALSTGTDKYLVKVFEHCYEEEDQKKIKKQLKNLDSKMESAHKKSFAKASKSEREGMLMAFGSSENEEEKDFFETIKRETITGFTTAKTVLVNYRNYQVAPGFYHGCADLPSQT